MTRKTPILAELLNAELIELAGSPAGTLFYREWYCKPPGDVPYKTVRDEWAEDPGGMPVQRVYEIRLLVICSGPGCGNTVESPRRRFCSDTCARRGRKAEKHVETAEFGKATIRMIRAAARRTGASDIATFGMLWDLQREVGEAVTEAIDALRDKGFPYEQLGAEIGVSRNAISQWHKRHLAKLAGDGDPADV